MEIEQQDIGLLRMGLAMVFGLWVLVLDVLAVRGSLRLSTGRAVAVLLLPFAILVLLSCVGGLLLVATVLHPGQ